MFILLLAICPPPILGVLTVPVVAIVWAPKSGLILEPAIAAELFTSALTITQLAIENAPVFDISISPEGFTDVATPDPLPTNIFPSANVANLL